MIRYIKSNFQDEVSVKEHETEPNMAPDNEYEQYVMLHRDFSKTYSQVYKHIMDFYPLPEKFIHEAAPEIETYIEKLAAGATGPDGDSSFQQLTYFARNVKAFATTANEVFEEYKGLHGESGSYIKKVFRLKELCMDDDAGDEFARLIPVLKKLIGGFKQIDEKTDQAAKNLQKLQSEWISLKANLGPNKNGTAWPL